MSNYKENEVAGTTWTRARAILITNPIGGVPAISFVEEDVFLVGQQLISRDANSISFPAIHENFLHPMTEFPLLHPETGDVIGTSKYLDLQVILYSLYMHLAGKRDNPTPYVPPEGPLEPIGE